ncbi:CsbD family protein [Roseomonas pecuniae]|uniref:CsbD family protein n=1 Tax=Roseomonas populi TaxID=3121582 RepID=A0ABT1X0H9_9PROT|nr:CsbD family protein [Roseomonas pecuniae]
MDKDRVEGSLKQAGGAIKENVGAAIGDKKMEAEGAAKRAEGKVQNAAGGVKDAVRDATDKA